MFSFELPSPVTTAQQNQYSSVMTLPASFSSGNRFYHPTFVQDKPYIHQWHSGGAERVTPHLYDATTEADFGVCHTDIQNRSSAQRIAAYKPRKLSKKLTKSQSERIKARLGKEPDTSIAADFGVSQNTIWRYRSAQGISAFHPLKRYNRLTKSQSERIQVRLGKEPDASIAADLGMTVAAIQHRRNTLGIAAYEPHNSLKKLTQSQLDNIQVRLGKESDASIAADFKMSRTAIRKLRSTQGIAAYSRPRKSSKKLTQIQSERVRARLEIEPDAVASNFEESVNTIWRSGFSQGSTAYEPHDSHQLHQLSDILPSPEQINKPTIHSLDLEGVPN